MTSCGTEVSSRVDVIVVPTRFHPHVTGSFNRKVRSPLPQSCLFTVSTVQSSWKKKTLLFTMTIFIISFWPWWLPQFISTCPMYLWPPFSVSFILSLLILFCSGFPPFFTSSLIFLLFFKMTFTFRTQRIHYRVEFHLKFLTFLVINFDVDVFTEQDVKA